MKTTMTNELPAEIMENGIHYTLVGDYYFPTCMLADRSPNGKWASLYERYLQEKHPHEYVRLIWYLDSTEATRLNPVLISPLLENAIRADGQEYLLPAFNCL